jgi:hypothetical protein
MIKKKRKNTFYGIIWVFLFVETYNLLSIWHVIPDVTFASDVSRSLITHIDVTCVFRCRFFVRKYALLLSHKKTLEVTNSINVPSSEKQIT